MLCQRSEGQGQTVLLLKVRSHCARTCVNARSENAPLGMLRRFRFRLRRLRLS